MKINRGYLMIAAAGSLWGTLGFFGNILFDYGFTPQMVVFCRLFIGFLILLAYICIRDRKLLELDKRGLKYTALIGFFSQALFNLLYFQTIKITSIATAVVLLYTAPAFLMIMGYIIYKESLSALKLGALFSCIAGCFLTVTGGAFGSLGLNPLGVLMGIGAGFTYSLVTIFSKAIVEDYNPLTIILYSFLFGWIFLLPFSNPTALLNINYNIGAVMGVFGIAFFPSVLSYIFYITGLTHKIEASKAGIICSLEIVVSVIISYFVFNEYMSVMKLIGILLVLSSTILVQLDKLFPVYEAVEAAYIEKENELAD